MMSSVTLVCGDMLDNDAQTVPQDVVIKEHSTALKRFASPDASNRSSQNVTIIGPTGTKKPRSMPDQIGAVESVELDKTLLPEPVHSVADVWTSDCRPIPAVRTESSVSSVLTKSLLSLEQKGHARSPPPLHKKSHLFKKLVDLSILEADDFNVTENDLNLDFETVQAPSHKPVSGRGKKNSGSAYRDERYQENDNSSTRIDPLTKSLSCNSTLNCQPNFRKIPNNNSSNSDKSNPSTYDTSSTSTSLEPVMKSTSHFWASGSAQQSSSHHTPKGNQPSKRKFPGPAGALPKLSPHKLFGIKDSPSTIVCDSVQFQGLTDETPISSLAVPASQSVEDRFQKEPWLAMKKDFACVSDGQNLSILRKFTIAWVLKKAARKRFSTRKIPLLCVLLTSIMNTEGDVSAVLQDPTGKIIGTICCTLMEKFASQIQPGCVFVLRQIGVFSPSPKKHYLNITFSNVVRIYGEDDQGEVNCLHLSDEPWCDIVKEASEVVASPFLARQNDDFVLIRDSRLASVFASPQMNPPPSNTMLTPRSFTKSPKGIGSITGAELLSVPNFRSSTKPASLVDGISSPFSTSANDKHTVQKTSSEIWLPEEHRHSSSTSAPGRFKFRSAPQTTTISPGESFVGSRGFPAAHQFTSQVPHPHILNDDLFGMDDELDNLMQSIDVESMSQK